MAPPKSRRPGYSKRAQYSIFAGYVIALAGAVIGLFLVGLSLIDPRGFAILRTAGAEITAPVGSFFAEIGAGLSSGGSEVSAYFNAASKNRQMTEELERSRLEILEARALKQENERLKRLLALRDEVGEPIAIGRLISSTASSSRRIATLGAGSSDGVVIGQPVRAPEGLVGRVLETGPNVSRILLASDTQNVTPVKRAKDELPAIATGRADGTVDVQPIDVGVNPFAVGDLLTTSGSGGLYPPNIPVAIIIEKTETGAFARILANPAQVGHVLVLPIFQPETLENADDLGVERAEEMAE